MRVEQEWKEGMEPSHELNEVFNRMEAELNGMNLSSKMEQTWSTSMYLSKGASSSRKEHKALRGFCGVDLGGGELDDPSGIIVFRDQDKGQTVIPRHESWSNCAYVYMRKGSV